MLEAAYHYFKRKGITQEVLEANQTPPAPTPSDLDCNSSSDYSPLATPRAVPQNLHETSNTPQLKPMLGEYPSRTADPPQFINSYHHNKGLRRHVLLSRSDRHSESLLRSSEAYFSSMFGSQRWILATSAEDNKDLYPSMRHGSLFNKYHNLFAL
jgi:hypothetical protein